MDPQVAWDELCEAYAASDYEAAREMASSLLGWLRLDGFPPQTMSGRKFDKRWNRTVVKATCEMVLAMPDLTLSCGCMTGNVMCRAPRGARNE